jgi:hypothetical protein
MSRQFRFLALGAIACFAAAGKAGGAAKPVDPADVTRVAVVPDPAPLPVATAGPALTPEQTAGFEPVDTLFNESEAEHRQDLPNMQTTHERENGLDPVSRSPNVGVTANAPLTAVAAGAPVTDMSGRGPMPSYQDAIGPVRDALRKAMSDDKDLDDNQRGWRTPQDLGVPRTTIEAMIADGAPIESANVPNGHFFPETGTKYRIARKGHSVSE